jgi:hypothetical protein
VHRLGTHLLGHARAYAFGLAFLAGLAVRLVFLPYVGTSDMTTFLGWGADAAHIGLAQAYNGNYFPLQWWIFEEIWRAAHAWHVNPIVMLRLVNLIFDIGCFALLVVILRKWNRSALWALVYWLHPYFLALAWLGYVDVQGLFFTLAVLALLSGPATRRRWLLAGLPLGAALLMKPQDAELLVFLVLLLLVDLARARSFTSVVRDGLLLLVAPSFLFVAVSVYLALAGDESITYLTHTYITPSQLGPSLSAQMPNLWLPVAEALKTGSDENLVQGPLIIHLSAALLTGSLLIATAAICSRVKGAFAAAQIFPLWALSAALVPMVFTEAHENHFFLAAVLLTLMAALQRDRILIALLSSLLFVQFTNLFLHYGFGANHLTTGWVNRLISHYDGTTAWATVDAVLSVALFAAVAVRVVQAILARSVVRGAAPVSTVSAVKT